MSKGKFIKGLKSFLYRTGEIFCLILSKIFVFLIRFYQICISPLFPAKCRFRPTCSAYALEAIKKYGPFKGLFLSIRRILKCHPFHKGGYDPVP